MIGWQPIETAPEGERILVYCPVPRVSGVPYSWEGPDMPPQHIFYVSKHVIHGETSYSLENDADGMDLDYLGEELIPTHWHPLPEPPENA